MMNNYSEEMKSEWRKFGKALIFAVLFATMAFVSVGCASATTHYVNPGESIQTAVNTADPGDTIIVRDGTYTENVNVNKHLTIKSENGSDVTIVQAKNSNDEIFKVTANYVNISGFTVIGAIGHIYWPAGIYLYDSCNSTIANNNVSNNGIGIRLLCTNNNTISNNNVSNNKYGISHEGGSNNVIANNSVSNNEYGMFVRSSNNIIANNNVSNNRYGIHIYNSCYITLRGNQLSNNKYNFGIDGCKLKLFIHDIDMSNKIDGKPIYYLVNVSNYLVSSDAGFVGVINSNNVTVKDLTLKGVLFAYTRNSRIENVIASDSMQGFSLRYSSNNIIANSNISNNEYGIYLEESSNNITNNNVSNNEHGIYLWNSNNNRLRENRLSNNKYNFGVGGYKLEPFIQDIDTSNKIDGKPLYYLVSVSDYLVPSDAGFVGVINSNNVTVKDLTLENNSEGILFAYTRNSRIENVIALNNKYGIYGIFLDVCSNNIIVNNSVSNSYIGICHIGNSNTITNNNVSNSSYGISLSGSDNTITNNNISLNDQYGISLRGSDNTITNNSISNNRYGIYLWSSGTNILYLNNFIDNARNAYSSYSAVNIWNSTSKITYTYNGTMFTNYLGNYWSDYTDVDANADGIWDNPHSIDSDWDYRPLVGLWESYFKPLEEKIFDTGSPSNPYPSIMGNYTGTITPNQTITVSKLYTYPCEGTGGHTEYAKIYNDSLSFETLPRDGYKGDWHNISFNQSFTLVKNKTYNYTIVTGSYPQIHHTPALPTTNGWINCTEFIDANGKKYYNWIPAIRLE